MIRGKRSMVISPKARGSGLRLTLTRRGEPIDCCGDDSELGHIRIMLKIIKEEKGIIPSKRRTLTPSSDLWM